MGELNVLIVDDEVLIGVDLAYEVERCGARPIGPAQDLETAGQLAGDVAPGLAFLDIDVNGVVVWPLARTLLGDGWSVTFISADPSYPELRTEFSGCGFLNKPASDTQIADAIARTSAARAA